MRILGKEEKYKKVIVSVILSFAMMISVILSMPVGSAAEAGGAIQYNNNVFTKKLYKNTKKIGFGPDGSRVAKEKKTVKKVYALLAKMELEEKEPDPNEKIKAGFVAVVIHTKDGKRKTYAFQGNEINRKYIITKNHPIDKIRAIYRKVKD